MKKELDEALVKKYPKIFAERHMSMKETAMCWGFECEDGWYDLIDNLCGCIQSYIDNNSHLNLTQTVAVQVKEKFGELRFYTHGEDELIHGMIWLAGYMSGRICELCGKRGEVMSKRGWYMCRCPEHAPKDADDSSD